MQLITGVLPEFWSSRVDSKLSTLKERLIFVILLDQRRLNVILFGEERPVNVRWMLVYLYADVLQTFPVTALRT